MYRLPSISALALAFGLVGCDAAAPSATADFEEFGKCTRAFTIFGPSTLAPGQTADYVANTDPDCQLYVVDWEVTSGNATIVGTGGMYGAGEVATVQAPSSAGSFTLRALVESSGGVSGRSKTVTVQ